MREGGLGLTGQFKTEEEENGSSGAFKMFGHELLTPCSNNGDMFVILISVVNITFFGSNRESKELVEVQMLKV